MSILSWNCRGLGQPSTVQELSRLVQQYCTKIVFLSETRQQQNRVSNLRFRFGYKNSFVANGKGKGGGLVIYWDESITLFIV
jgi:exonuclease III